VLSSELDEQGLQVAALRETQPHVVKIEEVTICSPFPPHLNYLGRCGAHFVGLNMREIPWEFRGRPAIEVLRERWWRFRPAIEERVAAA
jgi:hypothetical protein